MDLPHNSNPWRKFMQDYFVGNGLSPGSLSPRGASGFALRRILRGRHDPAGDLSHMFSGIGELTSQELRLNLHGLLKVGGVNQSSRMLERSLHVLLGER